jgi:RNA polymerase sigma factor (sigma-70 family)
MSESEAVTFAKAGDSDALGVLYALHRQRVFANCLKILRNHEEAEDLTQEVFLLVFEKIKQFQGRSSFSTWLHRLTVNCVLYHLRVKKRKPMSNLCDLESEDFAAPAEPFMLPTQHTRLEFFEAVDQLPKFQRTKVEQEIAGQHVKGKHGYTIHLFRAGKAVREHLA